MIDKTAEDDYNAVVYKQYLLIVINNLSSI